MAAWRVIDVCVLVIICFSCCCASRSPSNVTYLASRNGVLEAQNATAERSLCVVYYPNVTTFPSEQSEAVIHPILDLSSWDGCSRSPPAPAPIKGRVVIVSSGNCSIIDKAQVIEALGGEGVLVVVVSQGFHLDANKTYPNTIPIALIWPGPKETLVSLGSTAKAFIYAPASGTHIDYSLLVIWLFAVLTVGIGAYWSGLVRHELQKQSRLASQSSRPGAAEGPEECKAMPEEVSLSVTPTLVGVFVLCMCGMLLLLYFFFSYLVYVIIGLFVLASTTAVYQCLEPLVLRIPVGVCKLPSCNLSFMRIHVQVRQFILLVGAIALAACWVVYRKESFAWILQDILGFAFSVNMIRQVRLPSLKICTLLLVLLFFYDIFFVFVTPLFTKNGESVMVEVATGGNSGASGGTGNGGGGGSSSGADEQLPMVVRVPHLGSDPLVVCNLQSYSLLGFGDILVPGMLVGFCHGFDLATANRRKLYYIITLIAYGLGLLVTFAGLYLMAIAQPALLYLVPFTLIPVFVLGLVRHELKDLWNGDGQAIENTRLTGESRMEDGGSCQFDNSDPDQGSSSDPQPEMKDRESLMT